MGNYKRPESRIIMTIMTAQISAQFRLFLYLLCMKCSSSFTNEPGVCWSVCACVCVYVRRYKVVVGYKASVTIK